MFLLLYAIPGHDGQIGNIPNNFKITRINTKHKRENKLPEQVQGKFRQQYASAVPEREGARLFSRPAMAGFNGPG